MHIICPIANILINQKTADLLTEGFECLIDSDL